MEDVSLSIFWLISSGPVGFLLSRVSKLSMIYFINECLRLMWNYVFSIYVGQNRKKTASAAFVLCCVFWSCILQGTVFSFSYRFYFVGHACISNYLWTRFSLFASFLSLLVNLTMSFYGTYFVCFMNHAFVAAMRT